MALSAEDQAVADGLTNILNQRAKDAQQIVDARATALANQALLDQTSAYKASIESQAADYKTGLDQQVYSIKSAFDSATNNNNQVATNSTPQVVTQTKNNFIPILFTGLVLGYLYYKGKIKL